MSDRGTHKGFVSLGLAGGAGWASFAGYEHEGSVELGGTGRFGFVLSRDLAASFEIFFLGYSGEGDVLQNHIDGVLIYYPLRTRGLMMRAGIGYANATVDDWDWIGGTRQKKVTGSSGFEVTAGLGYEAPLYEDFLKWSIEVDYFKSFREESAGKDILLTIGVTLYAGER